MSAFRGRYPRVLLVGVASSLLALSLATFALGFALERAEARRDRLRDAGVAERLLDLGVAPDEVAAALATGRGKGEPSRGEAILESFGYEGERPGHWRVAAAIVLLAFSLATFGICLAYLAVQQAAFDRARKTIRDFMDGNGSARLEGEEEGGLSLLFSAINEMATALRSRGDEERRAKEFARDLTADISHQIRTPLTAIRMYTEIIQGESDKAETVRSFAAKAEASLDRMDALILSLLRLARVDSGMIAFERKPTPLADVASDAVSQFLSRAEREGVAISLAGDGGTTLPCDREWLAEAIGNLVKNALDHADGRSLVAVSWERDALATRISVRDDGRGIAEDDLQLVFRKFYRCESGRAGIGLGLPFARSIVEGQGGTLVVASKRGFGTTFTASFPISY